jgi:hypothetical protein
MFPSLIESVLSILIRVWDLFSGRAKRKLETKRWQLEQDSRQAQIDGDLDDLRRIRAELDEVDRKLRDGDY